MKKTTNEKIKNTVIIILFLFIPLTFAFSSCRTTRAGQLGDIRNDYTYIAGQLESSVQNFDRDIGLAISRSRDIEDTVEQLEYLFGEYEQAALRLRDQNIQLQEKTRLLEEALNNTINNSTSNNSNSCSLPNLEK